MSLLTQASLVLTPNAYKAATLYSIIPSNGNGDMTVARGTNATRINSSGVIETVGTTIPRLNYETVGGCPSILLEPQRTNLVTYSEDFSNAIWYKSNVTIIGNTITSPNGLINADTLIADGVLINHRTEQAVSVISGSKYNLSVFAKKNTNNFLQLFGSSTIWGVNSFANFDIETGVVGTIGSASSNAKIENVGNGWYKCSVTFEAISTATGTISFSIISSNSSSRGESNTLSTSVYVWGSQLEVGAYATSYIPTVASTVTRNADVITRSNIYTNGLITSAGGTWFIELNNNFALTRDAASNGIFLADSISVNNGFRIRVTAPNRFVIEKVISITNTQLYITLTDTVKIAIKWNGATADVYVNSVKVTSATAFTTTIMEIFSSSTTDVPKYIKSMMLFPTPLTDTECANLTTL